MYNISARKLSYISILVELFDAIWWIETVISNEAIYKLLFVPYFLFMTRTFNKDRLWLCVQNGAWNSMYVVVLLVSVHL